MLMYFATILTLMMFSSAYSEEVPEEDQVMYKQGPLLGEGGVSQPAPEP